MLDAGWLAEFDRDISMFIYVTIASSALTPDELESERSKASYGHGSTCRGPENREDQKGHGATAHDGCS